MSEQNGLVFHNEEEKGKIFLPNSSHGHCIIGIASEIKQHLKSWQAKKDHKTARSRKNGTQHTNM